ncbi:MAG: ABC transporter permease [Gemmatimonadetes bacterium]|nr:ABC transporter permease [Gemmatimonadota bacterium]
MGCSRRTDDSSCLLRTAGAGRIRSSFSDGTWRRRFGGDPSIVGRTIQLNGQAMEVIGVAPPVFRGTVPMLEPALFVPLMQMEVLDADRAGSLDNRGRNFLNVIARLRSGVTRDQAATRLEAVNSDLATAWPEPYSNSGTRIIPLAEVGTHPSMRTAQLGISGALLGVVFVLLLLACVNVASLFRARARDRAREMAVRLAIGASRWHLVRQLMIESLLFVGVAERRDSSSRQAGSRWSTQSRFRSVTWGSDRTSRSAVASSPSRWGCRSWPAWSSACCPHCRRRVRRSFPD